MYTIILLLIPFISAICMSVSRLIIMNVAVTLKTMLSEAIYQKALKVSSTAKGATSTGQLLNVMAVDTTSVMMFVVSIMMIVVMPIILIVGFVILASNLGKLTWVAASLYIVMILAQFVSVVLAQRTRKEMMSATDVRVKLMNEILTGIRIIKYYCWEKPFKGKID